MDILGSVNWKAKWIWKCEQVSQNDFAYFRKEINIEKPVLDAKMYVSAHNHYKLFINGKRVSGYMSPAPANPQKSKYYITYDVAEFLATGWNSICSVAHYIGGSGQNYVNGLPGFILQCHIIYKDSSSECFITDDTWKALKETAYKNGTEFQQNRRLSAIEDFDAGLEDEGWLMTDFHDSKWSSAVISDINNQEWQLKPQTIPEGYIEEIIIPAPTGIQKKGLQVFDAGKIVTGWARIELAGIKGSAVKMRYSEDICDNGRVKHNVCNEPSENYYDIYRMKGLKKEVWEPDFSYKAFRYVEITGYPEIIKNGEIKIAAAHTAMDYKGHFKSSNYLFNEIYEACIQTQKNNSLGQLVDCPHREQAQYLADSDLQAETLIYNFKAKGILENVLSDFKDAQLEDGRFPFVYPSNFDNKDFNIKIPEWDLHYCTLMWKIYYYYDDREILKKYYETAKRMINYYIGLISTDIGLVPKADGWHISDWPYSNIDESGEYLTVQNCKLYHSINIMVKAAEILGYFKDAEYFNKAAVPLKNSIVKYLYDKKEKVFIDSYNSKEKHQGTNVIAYEYNLVPEEDKNELLKFIKGQGFNCKTLLGLNLFRVLFENGEGDTAFKLLNKVEYPGWGYMINKKSKTIWEGFDDIESHCHAWNAYPARLLAEYIAGIKSLQPGFKEIEVKPFIHEGLSFVETRVPAVRGDISVAWQAEGNQVSIDVNTPADICVKFNISKSDGKVFSLCHNGKFIDI